MKEELIKRFIETEKYNYIGISNADNDFEVGFEDGHYVGFLSAVKLILTEEEFKEAVERAHKLAHIEMEEDVV
jgi:hypothetical protein